MYHSVGRVLEDWHWAMLAVPAPTFEDHLKALARGGYKTVGLAEVKDHVAERRPLPPRTVVLTLDDGYVDNWTYVVPLLRKYGFSATVLVTPEFVDPRDVLRPTLEDVWAGRAREDDLEVRGFMSWRELSASVATGTLSVQSHALTHTWYAVSPDVVDFHHPGDEHYWLDWNAFPADKPYYLADPEKSRVAWGTPVYRHAKSLAATTVYRPDPAEAEHLVARANEAGGVRLFARPDWRDVLRAALSGYRAQHGVRGENESDAERRARFERELGESKRVIERARHRRSPLGVAGGGYRDESLEMALGVYDS
jgi:peptidoglycan/xylan/chitin deacetylase (PgdA/CDA1 family)